MKIILSAIFILSIVTSGCISSTAEPENRIINVEVSNLNAIIPIKVILPEIPIIIPINHKPNYIPILKVYEIDKSSDIWHAKDSSSYITLNNEWVKYYANKVKNNEGISLYYKTDKEMYPYVANDDMWQNADYTVYTQQGDCEDLSILWVSIHRSLSRKAIVVGGYLEDNQGKRIRDFWYEYIDEYGHFTKIVSESAMMIEYKLVPKYMFNDKIQWSNYNENWYK